MKRRLAISWLVLFALSIPLLVTHFGRWQAAHAESENVATTWGDPHVGIVLDTTGSMQPEIDNLVAAWQEFLIHNPDRGPDPNCHEVPCGPLTATLHLGLFRDTASYFGNTTDRDTFGTWLAETSAGGGADCLDAALPGIMATLGNLPPGELQSDNLLLMTDATPRGKIQQYMFVLDKLQRRGVRLNTILSGSCGSSVQEETGLAYLSALSGGGLSLPVDGADHYTHTLINLSLLGVNDVLAARYGTLTDDQPVIVPLGIDGTITTLGVDDDDPNANCPPWCCLTCTLQMTALDNVTLAAAPGVQVELLTPGGTPIGPGSPGFFGLQADRRRYFGYVGCLTCTLSGPSPVPAAIPTGTWSLRLTGPGSYAVRVVADSTLNLAYLGRHNLPAGRPSFIRTALIEETGLRAPLTATFRLVSAAGQQSPPLSLFDDGNHNDGAAGDGIYGGVVTPSTPGLWFLQARGTLSDGSQFQRMDPTPVRVQRFQMPDLPDKDAVPGMSRQLNFTLSNDPASRGGDTRTFELAVESSQGWTITDTVPLSVTLAPGESIDIQLEVNIPTTATIGAVEDVTVVAIPTDDVSATAVARTSTSVVEELQLFLPVLMKP